jgi:thymidylate synthase ThyX
MYEAKIILDSEGPNGARLTTFELSYPRMVHADLMTHRVFSRNAGSSRAIPSDKLLKRIEDDPVLPVWWGKNQSGMQAREQLEGDALAEAKRLWLRGRDESVHTAKALGHAGLHKQLANRIVEPWMFITVLVTATEFSNFFALRDGTEAQPELADVAGKAHRLYEQSKPWRLNDNEWHLPLVRGNDYDQLIARYDLEKVILISIGRCARVSYLTHEGVRDPEADVGLYEKLLSSGHMSPMEHVGMAMTQQHWEVYARVRAMAWIRDRVPVGNFWGFGQWRKGIPLEHDFSLLKDR